MWARFTSSTSSHRRSSVEDGSVLHPNPQIVIFGAGLLGGYMGARLASDGGFSVHFVCRNSFQQKIKQAGGIEISSPSKSSKMVPVESFHMYSRFEEVIQAGVVPTHVILTMKRKDFADALKDISHWTDSKKETMEKVTIVPCFNGMFADPEILQALPDVHVCSTIWPWGIIPLSMTSTSVSLMQASDNGHMTFPQTPPGHDLSHMFKKAGFAVTFGKDMEAQMNGRLIMAMNNALNALSGIPIKDELMIRGYRNIISKCLEETVSVFNAAQIRYQAPFSIIPASRVPTILNMPDFLFGRTIASFLSVDGRVLSAMHYDFLEGKKTEVDFLQGVVVQLGEKHSIPTPVLSRIWHLVKQMETKHVELGKGLVVKHSPEEILECDLSAIDKSSAMDIELEPSVSAL